MRWGYVHVRRELVDVAAAVLLDELGRVERQVGVRVHGDHHTPDVRLQERRCVCVCVCV